ncbi:cation:proton antiporter [Porphyromonas pogonae]|uniref:cation:proton antiporter n=1 Tax=Porphyromonas pogonae TaxID=867595 RepID=UPI002E771C77|nr:cation:proton antiporter [Porphyromonas pogonae]
MKDNKFKASLFYVLMLGMFSAALFFALKAGTTAFPHHGGSQASSQPDSLTGAFGIFQETVQHHVVSTIGLLLLQILVILIAARTMGWLFSKMKQPAVIGEIVAGILLGPSLLGAVFPETFAFLFPKESLQNVQLLSQFGLILFMFAVGMELRIGDIKERFTSSVIISHAGIFIPFALSLPISYYIYSTVSADGHIPFVPFALFVGIAMSITAFPVLARIIQENNMSRTHLGKLALSSAANGDITAWLILAGILAITQSGSMLSSIYNLGFLLVYLGIMFGIIRPLFKVIGKVFDNTEVVSHTLVGIIFILLLLSSYVTELLSMHALFGAFILGLIMPEDVNFRRIITDKVEDVSLMLFLPLFFVASGLQTELGLINNMYMWLLLLAFVAIAVVGKVGGTFIAARACGEPVKESLYLGALMNTRGLMELVVLAIGFELGVLPPMVYAILVLMTIITTVMTAPLIDFINIFYKRRKKKEIDTTSIYSMGRVLVSFGRPSSGALLLNLANQLLRRGNVHPEITAMHITLDKELNPVYADTYYKESFKPLLIESEKLNLPVKIHYEVADNVEHTVMQKLAEGGYNLLLVGAGLGLSSRVNDKEATSYRKRMRRKLGSLPVATAESLLMMHRMLKDKMDFFVKHSPCSVGILVDRDFVKPKNILVLIDNEKDCSLMSYARAIRENNHGEIKVQPLATQLDIKDKINPQHETLLPSAALPSKELLEESTFMIVSYDLWKRLFEDFSDSLQLIPSTLILNLKI